jgi:hypothetical protein
MVMPRGDKDKYTDKQIRKADQIRDSYISSGLTVEKAEKRAWSTVNKDYGGGNKSGSGRGVPDANASERKPGRKR